MVMVPPDYGAARYGTAGLWYRLIMVPPEMVPPKVVPPN